MRDFTAVPGTSPAGTVAGVSPGGNHTTVQTVSQGGVTASSGIPVYETDPETKNLKHDHKVLRAGGPNPATVVKAGQP